MPDEPTAPEQKINEPSTPPATPAAPTAEDRIKNLVGSPEAVGGILGQITAGQAAIAQRLDNFEQKLAEFGKQPPPASVSATAQTPDYGALFGTPPAPAASAPQQLDAHSVAKLVQTAVQEAVAPLTQRVQADEAVRAKIAKQKASMALAVQSLPQLAEAGSAETQLFNQIYNGMPELQGLERAPEIISEMVRGLSVSSRSEDRQIADRKVQAAADVPRYGTIEVPDDTKKANELKAALVDEGSKRGMDVDDMAKYMQLEVGTAIAKQLQG